MTTFLSFIEDEMDEDSLSQAAVINFIDKGKQNVCFMFLYLCTQ